MGRHIAVLGGGLTGLSTAFHLSRRLPASRISLIEKSKELGGWVKSTRVELPGQGSVLLEAGPRTLRPNAPAILELVSMLSRGRDEAHALWIDTPPRPEGPSYNGSQVISSSEGAVPVHTSCLRRVNSWLAAHSIQRSGFPQFSIDKNTGTSGPSRGI